MSECYGVTSTITIGTEMDFNLESITIYKMKSYIPKCVLL